MVPPQFANALIVAGALIAAPQTASFGAFLKGVFDARVVHAACADGPRVVASTRLVTAAAVQGRAAHVVAIFTVALVTALQLLALVFVHFRTVSVGHAAGAHRQRTLHGTVR